MGREEDEIEQGNTNTNTSNKATTPRLQLQLLSLPSSLSRLSPDHHPGSASGSLTPPHHTHASVPFRWEAEPGKPKPCTTLALALALAPLPQPTKSLDLPPRLLNNEYSKMTKMPSPTTVLEGPYYPSIGRSILESSSFRFLRKRQQQGQGSFDGAELSLGGISGDSSPEKGLLLGPVGLRSSGSCRRENKKKGLFGSRKKRWANSFHGGGFVFSSFDDEGNGNGNGNGKCDGGERNGKAHRMSRKKSLSPANKSHFWASIYGALKQIIPRKNTKCVEER